MFHDNVIIWNSFIKKKEIKMRLDSPGQVTLVYGINEILSQGFFINWLGTHL